MENILMNISLKRPIIIAMIENINSIKNLEKILKIKNLDAILIGPYDLSTLLVNLEIFKIKSLQLAVKK